MSNITYFYNIFVIMKIYYDTHSFPTVHVTVTNETDDNNDFYNRFMNYWETKYKERKHFHFLFNFESLSKPNLGLLIDFVKRQKKLKEESIQYLDYSVVIVNNIVIKSILNGIWKISPPLNTVYLVSQLYIANQLINHLNNIFLNEDYISSFILCNNITKIL